MRKTDGHRETPLSIQHRGHMPSREPALSLCEGALQPQQFRKTKSGGGLRRWQPETRTWVQLNAVPDPSFSDVDNPREKTEGPPKPYFR